MINKTIDTTVITKLQAKNLINHLLDGKISHISNRIYKMDNAEILLCPVEKNGTIEYIKENESYSNYDDHKPIQYQKINHYLNFFELVTNVHEESSLLFQVFNNEKVKQDLVNKNLNYLESVKYFTENKSSIYPEPPNHFTLHDFFKYVFKNDLPLNKKSFLPELIAEYFSLDEIVVHANFKDKQELKAYIDPDLLNILLEKPCFSELKKIKISKAKIK